MDMYLLFTNMKYYSTDTRSAHFYVFKYFELKCRKHHRKVETLFTAVFKALLEKLNP